MSRAEESKRHLSVSELDCSVVLYERIGRVAWITLNRPERMNAINASLPLCLQRAVERANQDLDVHVIAVQGAGRGFCAGYDLKDYAEQRGRNIVGSQEMPWDPTIDYEMMWRCTCAYTSLWNSRVPTVAVVRGFAVAGGSDIALCCDIVLMEDEARIGYPPAKVWGVPTTAMWTYRCGAEKAKRMLLTGELVSGREAKEMGLVLYAWARGEEFERGVQDLLARISSLPRNQLVMQKLVINMAVQQMGVTTTQQMATLLDGVSRHTPEGIAFKKRVEEVGVKRAITERDAAVSKL